MKWQLLDLFSGIGGFSLGLERSGNFETVAFCEIEKFPRRVLARHWPKVPIYDDVRTLNRDRLAADGIIPDAICGGFPCQDISFAGKGAGLAGERSGLWFEYARLIDEIRPGIVIVENVAAILNRGIDAVLGTLASIGYDAEWHCIPAAAVGAPHRRDRFWLVAYADSQRQSQPEGIKQDQRRRAGNSGKAVADADSELSHGTGRKPGRRAEFTDGCKNVADADRAGLERWRLNWPGADQWAAWARGQSAADIWKSEPNMGGIIDGFFSWLDGPGLTFLNSSLKRIAHEAETGPNQILSTLRDADFTAEIQRANGGSIRISSAEVLLAYLCKLKNTDFDKTRLQLSRKDALKDEMRSVRRRKASARASYRPRQFEQSAVECANPLPLLSQFLARDAEKAWSAYRRSDACPVLDWECGIDRVSKNVPGRVDRLKSLGNAVVPQIPELIGRAIGPKVAA